ncbi:MAG: 50S ribosomal protein L32 [Cytophagia bacterium]|nr:MAG: 50S ribosomal protein L32 [Cytophagia bacterium]
MPNPKRKFSTTRRDKRRTHDSIEAKPFTICKKTDETHLFHRAYVHGNDLYYRGKLLIEGYKKSKDKPSEN